jgi:hypothetical protein
MKVLAHVDDNMARGPRTESIKFWTALHARFGLKFWEFVGMGQEKQFLGVTVFKAMMEGRTVYGMHQNADVLAFVDEHGSGGPPVKSPQPKKHELYSDMTLLGPGDQKRFRSQLMSCSWFACSTRLDIAAPVNRIAQQLSHPTVGGSRALDRVIRYLSHRPCFTLVAVRARAAENDWKFWVDSDLAGEPHETRSRTGQIFQLNGMPVAWRSTKQPATAFSSAAAEIYAFSEAARDARLMIWRAEDMGAGFEYPIKILEDNAATVSFQKSTTPYSKLKGVYNLRDKWVRELKDMKLIMAEKVDTGNNVADLLTKCHEWHAMRKLLKIIMLDIEPALQFRGC